MTTPEEAKFWSDKGKMERGMNEFSKEGAELLGEIAPENYERIKNNKEPREDYPLHLFKSKVKEWLHIEDDTILEIILAGVISEKLGGDPLWLFLIAPPGGAKTEILRSFNSIDFTYHLSDMSSKTLISGLMLGKGDKRIKVKDLLPELDGKVLIFKDFTTILEKGREERREIIAQLREAYDGSFSKRVGTLDDTIRYTSRFGLIAGVTPIIDKHWKFMQQLGERFLKIRWKENGDSVTKRSRINEGKEKFMRQELMENSTKFLENLSFKNIPEFDDEKYGNFVSSIAKFVAYARTPISIQDNSDFYYDHIPTPEVPTRLVKQLKKLAKCLAFIRGKDNVSWEEIKTLIRIAKDTIPQDRLAILEIIASFEHSTLEGCPRKTIFSSTKLPETSIRRILEQMKTLDLIKEKIEKTDNGFQSEQLHYYKLNDICWNIFGEPPEMLGDTK